MDLSLIRRRELRRAGTDAERALWAHLRAKRFSDFKFRRQHPVGPYILDFYCASNSLAIELDGGQHYTPEIQTYDERRTLFLCRRGITVLQFASDLIFREPSAMLEVIARALRVLDGPSP